MSNKTMLSEHFSVEELSCKCGCGFCDPKPELLRLAEEIRNYFNRPMLVTSCCRCESHNAYVGGEKESKHLTGRAMDFYIGGLTPLEIVTTIKAEKSKGKFEDLGGLGLYNNFVHVDIAKAEDGHLRYWDYRK